VALTESDQQLLHLDCDTMASVDLETAIKQEEDYLRKVHPTTDDIPGCMTLFDEFLKCHSML